MRQLIRAIRDRLHPLYHLRKSSAFRRVEGHLDIPVWGSLRGVDWRVRMRLMRHASYLVMRESPERGMTTLFCALADVYNPKRFWDVGANFGYYSWLLASRLPDLEVSLFEPDPSNVELIEATIARSGVRSFTLHPVAVSSRDGNADFAVDSVSGATGTLERPSSSFATSNWGVAVASIHVKTVQLDSFAGERPVDLLKIDVEGHEEAVFDGASRTLFEDRPIVVFESFRPGSPLFARLNELGYELYDAERATTDLALAENFLAVPPKRRPAVDALLAQWKRVSDLGQRRAAE